MALSIGHAFGPKVGGQQIELTPLPWFFWCLSIKLPVVHWPRVRTNSQRFRFAVKSWGHSVACSVTSPSVHAKSRRNVSIFKKNRFLIIIKETAWWNYHFGLFSDFAWHEERVLIYQKRSFKLFSSVSVMRVFRFVTSQFSHNFFTQNRTTDAVAFLNCSCHWHRNRVFVWVWRKRYSRAFVFILHEGIFRWTCALTMGRTRTQSSPRFGAMVLSSPEQPRLLAIMVLSTLRGSIMCRASGVGRLCPVGWPRTTAKWNICP